LARRSSLFLRILSVGSLLALLPSSALATPARSQALLGNPLIEDDTDLFTLPALTAAYGRSALLHIGAGGPMAGVSYGQNGRWQLGAFHNSTVAYNDLARTAANVGVPLLQAPSIVNLFAGSPIDDGSAIGFALNTSLGFQRAVPTGSGLSYQLAAEIELIFGYSTRSDTRHSDSAIAISYHRYMQRVYPNLAADTPGVPSFALRHRSIWMGDNGVDLGVYVEAARRDESFRQRVPIPSTATLARYFVNAGIGPRIRIADIAIIAPGVELGVNTVGGAIDTTGLGETLITVPRLRASIEVFPFPWLAVRAGATKSVQLQFSRLQSGDEFDASASGFVWTTGLGAKAGNFQVDATLSNALLLNGPQFVGGGAPGLFGSMSARYHF